jgi:hypothetical protein
MRTPEDAKSLLCPFARTFGVAKAEPGCRGPVCALWRFEKITTAHPLWKPAVLKRAEEIGDKPPYAKAAAWVSENKEVLGMVPTRGFCGAGGEA